MTEPRAQHVVASLPAPVGPITEATVELLRGPDGSRGATVGVEVGDPIGDLDLQLGLYCLHELHYRGFADVHDDAEWHPSVVALWQRVAADFESALRECVPDQLPVESSAGAAIADAVARGVGPSLSAAMSERPDLGKMREFAIHRSAYQLKEADPHSFALPRLGGAAKAALVEIQMDEYGHGRVGASHAELFAETMRALGLADTYGHYLEALPATTLATNNVMSHLALHRRLLPALLGHLALFEMTSVEPMRRYADAMCRLGMPASARAFYDVHVAADAHHGPLARTAMVDAYVSEHPASAGLVVWGAEVTMAIERRFTEFLLGRWAEGRSSLRSSAVAPTVSELSPQGA